MLRYPRHREMRDFVRDLNHIYLRHPAFWAIEESWGGFEWLQADGRDNSIFAYARKTADNKETVLVILNMTPASYGDYIIPVPREGFYRLLLNSDAVRYGGSGYGGLDQEETGYTTEGLYQGDPARQALRISLPPLAGLYLHYAGKRKE